MSHFDDMQSHVLNVLLRYRLSAAPLEEMIRMAYLGMKQPDAVETVVRRVVHLLRKRGYDIETIYGYGYRLWI